MSCRFELSWPPPANHRLFPSRGRLVKATKSANWQKRAALEARTQGARVQTGELNVSLVLYRPRRVGDIDGPIKNVLDALNGIAWVDDKQIVELHVYRFDDRARPRVVVHVDRAPAVQTVRALTNGDDLVEECGDAATQATDALERV